MKITLKYGIAVTAAIAAWVALKHFVLHFEGPSAQLADLFVFNLAAILGLVLGIKAKRRVMLRLSWACQLGLLFSESCSRRLSRRS